jgi:hypothetical protein
VEVLSAQIAALLGNNFHIFKSVCVYIYIHIYIDCFSVEGIVKKLITKHHITNPESLFVLIDDEYRDL